MCSIAAIVGLGAAVTIVGDRASAPAAVSSVVGRRSASPSVIATTATRATAITSRSTKPLSRVRPSVLRFRIFWTHVHTIKPSWLLFGWHFVDHDNISLPELPNVNIVNNVFRMKEDVVVARIIE